MMTSLIRFVRNPLKIGVLLALWAGILYFFTTTSWHEGEVDSPLDLMLLVLPYIFMAFLWLSYACFYDIKKYHIEEILVMEDGSILRMQVREAALLFVLGLVTGLFVFGCHLYYYQQLGVLNVALIRYSSRVVAIYVLLMICIAICIGWAVALLRNRLYGLTLLVAAYYLFDASFLSMWSGMSMNNPVTWKMTKLFCLFYQHSPTMVMDADYLLTAENEHIYRALFFICLLLGVILLCRLRRRLAALLPLAASVVMLVLFAQPSGAVYFMDIWNYWDSVFYLDQYREPEMVELRETKCRQNRDDFTVLRYDMKLTVTDQVKASVTMVPSVTDLEEYQFTLHFLFTVRSVTDEQGHPLAYEQEGDYLLVHYDGGDIGAITVSYEGTTSHFYATTQGMILPANYKYFPVAGWHKVLIDGYAEDEKDMLLDRTFVGELLPVNADFNVTLHVKGRYPVYSNLNVQKGKREKGFTTWKVSGNSDGMTLIGNPYLVSRDIQGVQVICSSLDTANVPDEKNRAKYVEYFNTLEEETGFSMQGKTFIVSPANNYDNWCFGKDHTLATVNYIEDEIEYRRDGILYHYMSEEDKKVEQELEEEMKQLEEEVNQDE